MEIKELIEGFRAVLDGFETKLSFEMDEITSICDAYEQGLNKVNNTYKRGSKEYRAWNYGKLKATLQGEHRQTTKKEI